jgi:carbohydrate diacid regulator
VKDGQSAADLLTLACELAASLCAATDVHTETSYDVYRRALRGELSGSELEALSHEHQLPAELCRCVLVFHIVQTDNERAYDLLRDITPMQEKDVLIDMDRHTVVLLKDMSEEDDVDDLTQFAQALQETLMGETAHQMTIGIGRSRHTMDELRESYMEARRAIEVGRIFKAEESIYVYSRLILERFLMELPHDISAYYHSLLFNRKNQRLFNEEMLYTIDMFFKKDLNLSDTARQLYIHRNTLVYRLDKVQKQIGLDLRSFEDAVTFKILMELKKVSGEKPPRKS